MGSLEPKARLWNNDPLKAADVTAAIHFETEAYQVAHGKPMGRHFAGYGFLSAFARHASGQTVTGYVKNPKLGDEFCRFIKDFRPDSSPDYIVAAKAGALKGVGCLFTPSPINAAQAWQRELHGSRAWSLCGVNHTLSSARAMDGLTGLLTAPVQPWDAIVCTSNASRQVIETLFSRQEEYLTRQLGASRFVRPQLPVIPLGVDCDSQAGHPGHRDAARAALGVGPGDFVVLFLGRLSFHAKANPAPMYLALERLAARHRVVLVECGWAANDQIVQAFADARAKLCPSVRSIVLDGREPDLRTQGLGFGRYVLLPLGQYPGDLRPDPYRSHGCRPAGGRDRLGRLQGYGSKWHRWLYRSRPWPRRPGAGQRLAIRHALELDSYDFYIGQASTAVVVDIDATTAAFERLASDRRPAPDAWARTACAGRRSFSTGR